MALYTCIFTLLELHPSGRVLEVGVAGSAVREQVIHYVCHFPSRRGFLPISVGGGGGHFATASPTDCVFHSFEYSSSDKGEMGSRGVLICISLIMSESEHLSYV